MRLKLLYILLLFTCLVHAYQAHRPMLYSTLNTNTLAQYPTYEFKSTSHYYNTYGADNTQNSNRNGHVRKVHGYTGDGEYVGDDNGNESDFWEEGYEYYWDPTDKCWYRYNGSEWQRYTNTLGFLLGWHWAITSWGGRKPPSNPVSQGYQENPMPIGDGTLILLLISSVHGVINNCRKRKQRRR